MKALQKINPHIEIKGITDDAFRRYGRVLDIGCGEMIDRAGEPTALPAYSMSDPSLENTTLFRYFRDSVYGAIPIQAGVCTGRNTKLNCFEYHRGTEVNIAATDFVLLLAHTGDIRENRIASGAAEAFYVPAGSCVALYETTLHFAPICVYGTGFVCIVILPAGTNGELEGFDKRTPEDELLFRRNKWLLGHSESRQVKELHAVCGITGENITITPLEEGQ